MSGANVGKVYNLTGGGGGGSALKLESIEVTSPPVKTTYKSGESFDPTGLVVTASYSYGITAEVTGYTVSPTVLTDGVTEVTVTYAEKRTVRTARIPVTVEKVLVSIAVTVPPDKTVYRYLESFDRTGMVVTASFTDGSAAPAEGYSYPAVEFSTLGEQTVSLEYTYEGVTKTTSLEVTVVPIEVAVPAQKGAAVYDGTAQTPSWEGYDALKMAVEGELSSTDAGSYTAVFTLVYGYVFPGGESAVQVSWQIDRAVIAAVPVQVDIPAADGTPKRPAWEGYDPDKLTIGGERVGSEAGEYTATFTPTANYQWWDGSTGAKDAVWTIASVVVSIPAQKDKLTYTGAAQTPEWTNFDSEKCSADVTAETDAGEYTAVFTLRLGLWEDGSAEPKAVKWVIGRAALTAVPKQSGTLTYDGNPKTPVWDTSYDSAKLTLEVEAAVNAGDYTAAFTPTANYMWPDGSTEAKTVGWSILRANAGAVPSVSGSLTYTGEEQSPAWNGYDSARMDLSGAASGVDAGSYTAVFTPKDNYCWPDGSITAKSVSWTIGRASIAVPTQNGSLTYNGVEQAPSLSNYDADKMVLSGEVKGVNAGDYSITATPGANYQWSDGTTSAKTVKWSIGKAAGSLTLSASSVTLDSSHLTVAVTVTRPGDGVITAASSDPSVAAVSVSGTTVTIRHVNQTTGTATITVKVAAGTNHTSPDDKTITVKAQFATIYGVEWDWTNSGPTRGVRTDAAADFPDPEPAVNNGTGSSPFDNLLPWAGMVKENRTGGVMVKEPKYWFKWTKEGKKLKLQIADGPVDGFHVDPVNMDKGDGLGELDFSYIGRYHCAKSTYKSETNTAQQVSITRSAARIAIHNLGANIWQMDFAQMWYVGMLFLVEFADWNGERIGWGCSTSASKANNGQTDAMQYHTGTTAENCDSYGFVQYRNIEGWWDGVLDWVDGCYYDSNGLNIITDPNQFSDSANGVLVGKPGNDGYPSELCIPEISTLQWALYPIAAGGTNSTYVPDYWKYFHGNNKQLSHGGSYQQQRACGPFRIDCTAIGRSDAYNGCRLQERPPKEV